MDEFNRNTGSPDEPQNTPYQTPVRGADETASSNHTYNTYGSGQHSDASGSTPPPNDASGSSYAQWSGGNAPKPPKKEKKNGNSNFPWKGIAAVVVVGMLAFGGGMLASGGIELSKLTAGNANSSTVADGSGLPDDSTKMTISETSNSGNNDAVSYSGVYEKVSPSIVAVVVDAIQLGSESSGSGVIMSEDGYIITNNHVVTGGDKFTVVLSDSTTHEAELIGTDEQTDLAVLKIDATGLTAAEFGDSESLHVGDRAFAIGSPGGIEFQNSFTGGFISAINRNVTINDRVMTLIQTDTAINPGNSGGALINVDGQIIGITSSKLTSSSAEDGTSYEGMGFAIPTTTVKEVVDQLIAYGHVTGRPAIGISGYDIDEARAAYYSVPQGVLVTSVNTASDAYAQGVKEGDIVTGVNGQQITSMTDINTVKNDMSAGDTMELTLYRSGRSLTVTITLVDQANLAGTSVVVDNSSSPAEDNSFSNPHGNGGGYGYGYVTP